MAVTSVCQRDLPHAVARGIMQEADGNRAKSNPPVLGLD